MRITATIDRMWTWPSDRQVCVALVRLNVNDWVTIAGQVMVPYDAPPYLFLDDSILQIDTRLRDLLEDAALTAYYDACRQRGVDPLIDLPRYVPAEKEVAR